MEISDKMLKLDVSLYGNMEPLTETLSKCRVRIFYKGLNRNRTFISDDFANQLISSLPYAPIKGIFDKDQLDFGDHGEMNSDGRVYGIVAADPEFAWEKHMDDDGVERDYCCATCILFTALYPEANLIPGKSQSMEIYRKGLTGEWKIWEGDMQPYYHFYTGHLLGLQTLGDEVEPCFEGSAFYSLSKDIKELMEYVKKNTQKEESTEMEKNVFKLSDCQKEELLFKALNTSSEGEMSYILDVYDEYALCRKENSVDYFRAYYTKNDNEDSVVVDKVEPCYVLDITESEKNALEAMRAIGSYTEIQAKIEEMNAQIESFTVDNNNLNEQLAAANQKINEFEKNSEEVENNSVNEETTEEVASENGAAAQVDEDNSAEIQAELDSYKLQIEEKDAEIARLNQLNSDITNEKSELENFKKAVDNEKKQSIITEFSNYLSEEQISSFNEKMNDYSVEDFKKEVCFAAYNSDNSIFSSKEEEKPDLIYKNTPKDMDSGALKLLNKHKGGNK